MPIIEVNNVTKEYRLGQFKSLRQSIMSSFDRWRGRWVEKQSPFKALDDVNFKVEKGEVVGIIGTNGAGKSTLLKLLARISTPTRGSVKVHGSVAPLIEVGAGLHPELTGRENIYLNAVILGVKRAEIRKRFDEIVQFAELEEFIDTPVKRYSSGMKVRLGFSIAVSIDADILIVDEVLAVGDLAFQRKCFDRMEAMIKRQGKTVLIVGHQIRQLERICSRMLLMDKGQVLMDEEPAKVCYCYYSMTNKKVHEQRALSNDKIVGEVDVDEINVLDITLFNGAGEPTDVLEMHGTVRIGVRFEVLKDLASLGILLGFHTSDFVYITTTTTDTLSSRPDFGIGSHYVECYLDDMVLKPGSYSVRLSFYDRYERVVWYGENLKNFKVIATDADSFKLPRSGLIDLKFNWDFDRDVLISGKKV